MLIRIYQLDNLLQCHLLNHPTDQLCNQVDGLRVSHLHAQLLSPAVDPQFNLHHVLLKGRLLSRHRDQPHSQLLGPALNPAPYRQVSLLSVRLDSQAKHLLVNRRFARPLSQVRIRPVSQPLDHRHSPAADPRANPRLTHRRNRAQGHQASPVGIRRTSRRLIRPHNRVQDQQISRHLVQLKSRQTNHRLGPQLSRQLDRLCSHPRDPPTNPLFALLASLQCALPRNRAPDPPVSHRPTPQLNRAASRRVSHLADQLRSPARSLPINPLRAQLRNPVSSLRLSRRLGQLASHHHGPLVSPVVSHPANLLSVRQRNQV